MEPAHATVAAAALGGLLGSGHCFGMCGPFAGFLGVAAGGRWTAQLGYQLGRLTTYAALGVAMGILGAAASGAAALWEAQRVLQIGLGVALVAVGAQHLFGLRIPGSARLFAQIRAPLYRLARGGRASGPYLLGLSSTLLPCGFLYGFALVAASTGRLDGAVFTMLGFWAGTVPALLLTGLLARFAATRAFRHSHRVIGVVLIVLGLVGVLGRWAPAPVSPAGGEPSAAPVPACCEEAGKTLS